MKGPSSTTARLVPTLPIESTERPWKMKLRLKSHYRWVFLMVFLQLTNEVVPYETYLLGSSNLFSDLIIYMACLIPPAIYWGMIVFAWVKLSQYKKNTGTTYTSATLSLDLLNISLIYTTRSRSRPTFLKLVRVVLKQMNLPGKEP
jgi:hypothetical protein